MSADKNQALHEAFADAFSESSLISTHTEPSHPVFDHEALSEIFSDSPQIATHIEPSHPVTDHESLSEIFSERHLISTTTERWLPTFDHADLAGVFSEPLPISTNRKPSLPGFDHQALAEILSDLRPVPNNPQPSPVSFDTGYSSASLSDQLEDGKPAAKTVAVASSTSAESARSQRATSLLAKLSYIFSTEAEPPPSSVEKDPSPPSASGQLHKPEPVAKAIAAASSTDAESARPQQAKSLPTEFSPVVSRNSELPPLSFEQEPSSPRLSNQPGNVRPAVRDIAATSPTDTASAQPPRATSLLTEISSLIPTNTESSPPIFEKNYLPPPAAGRLDNMDPQEKVVVAAPADAENARRQQAKSLLTELRPEKTYVESTQPRQANSSPTELPQLISINSEISPPSREKEPSRPTSSNQLSNLETVSGAPPTDAESAVMQPRDAKPWLSEVSSLDSTNTKPPSLIYEDEPSPISLSGQPDSARPSVKAVVIAHPTDAESAVPQHTNSLLAALRALVPTNAKPSPPIFEKEPSRPPVSDQPANAEPTAKAVAVAPPADTESAVTRTQQAKSLLAELDLNTAIRLRWVMRDIRSKRTKLSPVSDNDLTALMDLGLVEIREEQPRLTASGVLALD